MTITAPRTLFKKTTLFATAFVLAVSTMTAAVPFILAEGVGAVGETVATEGNMQGWIKYSDTDTPLQFGVDADAPMGEGALKLSTPTDSEWIQIDRSVPDSAAVNARDINVSYQSKRLDGSAHAAPAFVLAIDKDGNLANSDDTFWAWYEPVYNNPGANYTQWNTWSVTAESQFWYNGATPAGVTGYQTLNSALAGHLGAKVSGYTLNMGTGNGGWSALVDNVRTPEATYDFEPTPVAAPANLRLNESETCSFTTNAQSFTATWDADAGAESYNYKVTLPDGSEDGPVNIGNVTSRTGEFGSQGTYTIAVQAVGVHGTVSTWSDCAVTYDIDTTESDSGTDTDDGNYTPITPTPPSTPETLGSDNQNSVAQPVLPFAFGFNNSVLGTNTNIPAATDNDNNGPADVEGVSTSTGEDILAQAIDTDGDGSVYGIAWYWWLLALAALATIGWWIAAARRRNAEN